ncbi:MULTISPECIES: phosphogluconate dehydrogenase C-terminal domain-containing protein [unclassified Halomonas]|uniref:NAD(P)-binding domain-containing protein n=1 Tax=Halomonas sp. RT37 TaxID=2950872 RepID=A0AAU7KJ94_9GAMM|nr:MULTISPECIES: phosphogluconate dehydrogenase C-terminal domain-containing protein [unclassified Halomonas]MBS8268368.1 semialdehyde dehydrogenase [Halomonas litopenaei]MAR73027.1 semialdehyde dehydrogenase [Halomonas sp.]MAY69974.1 semialdehyde dehydrogenase [Halomonas sp.]MBY5939917.1 NAD(P)-binding domain-containing protein [Halomonas sp. DP5N14-9]MCO7216750.1 NAD(P)-binding domain-containing protein [Halomonas sp. OfavH-34-E]|tara:strand:+ start:439 stop:1269 length:831 start_codon:yes stop_codon:yes gene_type:complete
MTTIALIGAGGKMGARLSRNLKTSDFDVRHVEVSEQGRQRLRDELDIECVDSAEQAVAGADVVILAVPDTLIQKIAAELSPSIEAGTMVVCLDAAAPFAGHLPERDDLVYFVTHPCHPPIFNDETTLEAKRDYFGGSHATQHIVSALMQGDDRHFALGEAVARTIYAPVGRSHRVSVEQMALLEPGLSETVCATLLSVMREAMDEVVDRGVSHECARDFLLGHLNILGAVIFDEQPGAFSDACNKAIENGKPMLMRDDWKRVFEPDAIADSIQRIT